VVTGGYHGEKKEKRWAFQKRPPNTEGKYVG